MSNMKLCHLVIGHIVDNVAPFVEHIHNVLPLFEVVNLDTEKYLRGTLIIQAVIEFRNCPLTECLAQTPKASRFFRNADPQQGFSTFPEFRPFRNMPEAVKVDI